MKKALRIIISVLGTLYFAACIFCFSVAGAPADKEGAGRYVFLAGIFAFLLSLFVCVCLNYICYLQKQLEDRETEDQA